MSTLFISDLHLSEERSDLTELFLKFLHDYTARAESLYILGDFFEYWIGDDDQTPLSRSVAQALNILSQKNCKIYFTHGNRDFLVGKRFAKSAGMKILKDYTVINLYGVPTLLMHGDTLCTQDIAYLKFRKKVRNPITQFLFLCKKLESRRNIALQLRAMSKSHIPRVDPEILDVTASEIPRIMKKYHTKLLIHGHTHRPGVELIKMGDEFVKRIVLSDWEDTGNFLICEPGGINKLVYF